MNKQEILNLIINALNDSLNYDRDAISFILSERTSCNKKLADHPKIQVLEHANDPKFSISSLGLINGIVEELTGEKIAACYDSLGKIVKFEKYDKNQK